MGKYSVLYKNQKVRNNRRSLSARTWASQSEFELVHFYLNNWAHSVKLPNRSGLESVICEVRAGVPLSRECCADSVKQPTGTGNERAGSVHTGVMTTLRWFCLSTCIPSPLPLIDPSGLTARVKYRSASWPDTHGPALSCLGVCPQSLSAPTLVFEAWNILLQTLLFFHPSPHLIQVGDHCPPVALALLCFPSKHSATWYYCTINISLFIVFIHYYSVNLKRARDCLTCLFVFVLNCF